MLAERLLLLTLVLIAVFVIFELGREHGRQQGWDDCMNKIRNRRDG